MNEDYVALVITPDSIRDGLEYAILTDIFTAVTAEILWTKEWYITTPDTVLKIYPNLPGRISFASVIKTMMLGKCLVLLLRGICLYQQLKEVKGRIAFVGEHVMVTGLRHKYRNWTDQELITLGCTSQTALDKIFEFRLHTTDTLQETALLCTMCMSEKDYIWLHTTAPPLYKAICDVLCMQTI